MLGGGAHFPGSFDDEILGLAYFGNAGEVALYISREYGHAGTRKSLGHHLQRDGFSGSGRAGDEAMAICKPERQPRRLFTLADKNLLVGIGQLVVGCRHGFASSCASGVAAAKHHDYTASCKPIETGQRSY